MKRKDIKYTVEFSNGMTDFSKMPKDTFELMAKRLLEEILKKMDEDKKEY